MRSLLSKPNVNAADSDYPYGSIRDRDGATQGTPVTEEVYGDIHQFFEKLMAEAGVTANDLPDNDYNGFQLFEALSIAFIRSDNAILRTKIIEMGVWNMVSTEEVSVAHGLSDHAKIRSITAMIVNDAGDGIFPTGASALGVTQAWVVAAGTTNVSAKRLTGGDFDNVNFDDAVINRGWFSIQYEE
jgi:hypothetical protein